MTKEKFYIALRSGFLDPSITLMVEHCLPWQSQLAGQGAHGGLYRKQEIKK